MPAKRGVQPAVPKLNLIPPHIAAARRLTAAIIGTAVMVIVILAGMGAWWQSTVATVARLQADLQQKTQEADKVRELQRQAKLTRDGVAALSNRLDILDDIRKSGPQLAGLIRQIVAWVPEGVRLTALQFQGGAAPTGTMAAPAGLPGAPSMTGPEAMMGPEAAGMPGMPGGMGMPTSPAAGGTQVSAVTLIGYTQSLHRLMAFYSNLSQSDLFTSVRLELFEWDGRPYQGGNLPPILPKQVAGQKKEVGQGALTPTLPGGVTGAAPPTAPSGGATAPGAAPPTAPPGGMPPMRMMGPMPGMEAMPGGTTGAALVRDPTAPRNAVYFIIRATLKTPLSIAPKLHAPPPTMAGAMGGGMPGAMMPEAMPGAMPPGEMLSGGAAPPTVTPSPGGAAPGGEEEAAPQGLGRRRLGGEE